MLGTRWNSVRAQALAGQAVSYLRNPSRRAPSAVDLRTIASFASQQAGSSNRLHFWGAAGVGAFAGAATSHEISVKRQLHTSSSVSSSESQGPLSFATAHAVFRKPPYEEIEAAAEAERKSKEGEPVAPREVERPKIGFRPDTAIGKWKEDLLGPEEDAGEDAICITPMQNSVHDLCLAVADGVGGWTEEGVDPALFSQALMYYLTKSAATSQPALYSPKKLLSDAYQAVLKEPAVSLGSSTACVITLDGAQRMLRSANLGDSGYIVLREGARDDANATRGKARGAKRGQLPDNVLYVAPPLQYSFNAPYQLSKLTGMAPDALQNKPQDSAENRIQLQTGDIIVSATDGLWDNVHIAELVEIARLVREQPEKIAEQRGEPIPAAPPSFKDNAELEKQHLIATLLARTLVHFAVICMGSPNKATPFMVEAARHGINYPGGKIDDCSVVTAVVADPKLN